VNTRGVGRIPERVAEAVDDRVQAVLVIDESVTGPQEPSQLVARNELSGTFE